VLAVKDESAVSIENVILFPFEIKAVRCKVGIEIDIKTSFS